MEFACMQRETMDLPPGFRFHPTDEELITHYLANKVMNPRFTASAIGDVDLNKCEPWDLPSKAKMGEKECYFFCVNDRKYPTGLRTNRATESGYWKATGKDKEIYRGKSLVGMKKTLVFYLGRAPKGVKTNWVMHEFRLEGCCSAYNLPKAAKNEWVISKVFSKSSGVKKVLGCVEFGVPSSSHVTCFSNAMEGQREGQEELLADCYNNHLLSVAPAEIFSEATISLPSTMYCNTQYPAGSFTKLLESNCCAMNQREMTEKEMVSVSQETGITIDANQEISSVVSDNEMARFSFDGQGEPSSSAGYLWNY